jgi:5-methylcytosine-specific restriction endonuclease McrA
LPKAMMHKKTGKIHPRSPSIDHIVPMSRGGDHVESNLQTACFLCNSLKSNKGGGQMRLPIANH